MKFVNKNGRVYPKKFHRVSEVLSRFQPDDFWIRLNRRVFNLTSLTKQIDEPDYIQIEDYYSIKQLLHFGGLDVNDLFEDRLKSQMEMFDLKSKSAYGIANDLYWWNDPTYEIGQVTVQDRHVCIKSRTKGTVPLTVCEEDSIYTIKEKYYRLFPDDDADFHVWRKNQSTCCASDHLFLDQTLTENGLKFDPLNKTTSLWLFDKNENYYCSKIY